MSAQPRYVPSTIYIRGDGSRRISRGYTETGGIRIEDDILVLDQYGQPTESRGSVEVAPPRTLAKGGGDG